MMTTQEIKTIIAKYKSGKTLAAIAREHYTYPHKISQILKAHHIPVGHSRRAMSPGVKHMIANDWNAGYTVEQIAKIYKYQPNTVPHILYNLRKEGYQLRPRRQNRLAQADDIVRDWNAGMPAREIMHKYQINYLSGLSALLVRLRERGYDIKRRPGPGKEHTT